MPIDPNAAPPMDPNAAPPSPEDVAAAEGQADASGLEAIAAQAPMPEKPYKLSTIKTVIKELNKLVEKVQGQKLQPGEELVWEAPEGSGQTWDQPLPGPVFVPIAMLSQAAASDPAFEKHVIDLEGLTSDGALTKTSGMIRRMSGDKKFVEALTPPETPEDADLAAPPGEADMGEPPPMPEAPPPGI